jgi:hypothetical protein
MVTDHRHQGGFANPNIAGNRDKFFQFFLLRMNQILRSLMLQRCGLGFSWSLL